MAGVTHPMLPEGTLSSKLLQDQSKNVNVFHNLRTSSAFASSRYMITIPIIPAPTPLFAVIPKVSPWTHLIASYTEVTPLTGTMTSGNIAGTMRATHALMDTVFTILPNWARMLTQRTVVTNWTGAREVVGM